MNKQAFLIMYHTDYYILERLLKQIDNKKFDIYLHIDKKVKDFDFEYTKRIVKKSNLYFVKRLDVKWSTYSQIKCELNLFKEAVKRNYKYYHLISGNDLLLKDSDDIYNFFNRCKNEEFVGYTDFNNDSVESLERIKYYHILNKNRRHKNKLIRVFSTKVYYKLVSYQKRLGINRLKKCDLEIRKGANWVSITNELVKYILSCEDEIKRIFKYSNCADELVIQTLVYNSRFKDNVYNEYNDEHKNIKRYIDWNRGEPYTFTINDYDELVNSDCFFARKFSSEVDRDIIDKLMRK